MFRTSHGLGDDTGRTEGVQKVREAISLHTILFPPEANRSYSIYIVLMCCDRIPRRTG